MGLPYCGPFIFIAPLERSVRSVLQDAEAQLNDKDTLTLARRPKDTSQVRRSCPLREGQRARSQIRPVEAAQPVP